MHAAKRLHRVALRTLRAARESSCSRPTRRACRETPVAFGGIGCLIKRSSPGHNRVKTEPAQNILPTHETGHASILHDGRLPYPAVKENP